MTFVIRHSAFVLYHPPIPAVPVTETLPATGEAERTANLLPLIFHAYHS